MSEQGTSPRAPAWTILISKLVGEARGPGSMNTPRSEFDAWVRRRIRWTVFGLIALVAALGIGVLIAAAARLAAVDGLWIGCWLAFAAFSVAQIAAPSRMIE
jgi:hypothetical protein